MAAIRPWDGAVVLDIGCGTGFHLPRFAADRRAGDRRRAAPAAARPGPAADGRRPPACEVRAGTAQQLPVPDASVDVVHARWAYFFGPGCEPGLRELSRVLRRGGAAFVIDNDATRSTFGVVVPPRPARLRPRCGGTVLGDAGLAAARRSTSAGSTPTRADFEAVVRIEFAPEAADADPGRASRAAASTTPSTSSPLVLTLGHSTLGAPNTPVALCRAGRRPGWEARTCRPCRGAACTCRPAGRRTP